MITDEELARIEAYCRVLSLLEGQTTPEIQGRAAVAFLTSARTDLPRLVADLRALRKAVEPFAFIVEWAFSGGKTLPDDESKVDIRVKAGDLRRLVALTEVK